MSYQWAKEEVRWEIKKNLEINGNENISKPMGHTEKAVLSGFFFSYGELIRINPFIRKEKYSK